MVIAAVIASSVAVALVIVGAVVWVVITEPLGSDGE